MASADGRTGSTVGKYKLHEIVGRGGMGVVYRAEHVYIGREVAVKILHEGYGGREESIKRFLREARAASLINHPNIVEVTDFGKASDGTVFFVMELLIGDPLDNILARDHRLDLLRSITICNQLAAALAAAHSKGIIHRDLKPENVMLIPREGRRELVRRVMDESGAHELSEREKQFDFVKILDFGVAKVREPDDQKARVTKSGVVFGTPEYMAPETARIGHSDARSDIYALGVMFYEMMTGTVPFTAETPVEVMMKQVNERVPPMRKVAPDAEITEDAERMILKALAKDPEQRHQSMEEFHRDLQKCYGQLRFRRTVRTPTVATAVVENTPVTAAIPLTKKKRPASPGAIPNLAGAGASASGEIETAFARPRAPTPRLPGLPLNATAPILLTRKKAPRPTATPPRGSANASERTTVGLGAPQASSEEMLAPPPGVGPVPLPAVPVAPVEPNRGPRLVTPLATRPAPHDEPDGGDAIPRNVPQSETNTPSNGVPGLRSEIADDTHPNDVAPPPLSQAGTAPAAPQARVRQQTPPEKRKRTTLPLGLGQNDRPTPAVPMGIAPEAIPEGEHLDISPVMVALPHDTPDKNAGDDSPMRDRVTPPVALTTTVETDEKSWADEPTSPAILGYPDYPGKAGKAG